MQGHLTPWMDHMSSSSAISGLLSFKYSFCIFISLFALALTALVFSDFEQALSISSSGVMMFRTSSIASSQDVLTSHHQAAIQSWPQRVCDWSWPTCAECVFCFPTFRHSSLFCLYLEWCSMKDWRSFKMCMSCARLELYISPVDNLGISMFVTLYPISVTIVWCLYMHWSSVWLLISTNVNELIKKCLHSSGYSSFGSFNTLMFSCFSVSDSSFAEVAGYFHSF